MKRMSPPDRRPREADRDARDHVVLRQLGLRLDRPEQRLELRRVDLLRDVAVALARPCARACGRPSRSRARDCARRPRACSSRIIVRSASSAISMPASCDAVALELARQQEALRDLELLLDRVARQLDHLHAVPQRRRHRVDHVRRRDEEHLRQVEGHLEIVVAELVVLLGIEHLEQRRRRIAAAVRADLVDLVEQDDGIARPRLAQPLHDAARQRADVGAPMAADLRLVAHAAERDPHELRARARARSNARARSCPVPGGPTKQRIGPLQVALQREHRDVLDDAVLDLLEAEVVLVEDRGAPSRRRGGPRETPTQGIAVIQSR